MKSKRDQKDSIVLNCVIIFDRSEEIALSRTDRSSLSGELISNIVVAKKAGKSYVESIRFLRF